MKLGTFSISLTVQNIDVSLAFYQKLGFQKIGGMIEQKWVILRNDNAVIGLFEGMFDKNILTFNPGWDTDMNPLDSFDDVRQIEQKLLESDVPLLRQTEQQEGPEHILLQDPDGNMIMLDQHR